MAEKIEKTDLRRCLERVESSGQQEGVDDFCYPKTYTIDEAISEIKSYLTTLVEKRKKEPNNHCNPKDDYNWGYNQALTDILTDISNL